jgi:hypothetical protein
MISSPAPVWAGLLEGNMEKRADWIWYGHPAHFIGAKDCNFRQATEVGNYIVSTVGDYRPALLGDKQERLGYQDDSFYETMVFKKGAMCDCGCGEHRIEHPEIEGERYATALQAREGHLRYCREYHLKD